MDTFKLNLNLELYAQYGSIEDIKKGTIVVMGCSNLCNYNNTIEYLCKIYNQYDSELILKSSNNNFNTTHGSVMVTKVNENITIITLFSLYINSFKEKCISYDALVKDFNFIKNIENILPKHTLYIPMYFGLDMDDITWQICFTMIKVYLDNAVIVTNEGYENTCAKKKKVMT